MLPGRGRKHANSQPGFYKAKRVAPLNHLLERRDVRRDVAAGGAADVVDLMFAAPKLMPSDSETWKWKTASLYWNMICQGPIFHFHIKSRRVRRCEPRDRQCLTEDGLFLPTSGVQVFWVQLTLHLVNVDRKTRRFPDR